MPSITSPNEIIWVVIDWLEHHQVIAASLINISVVIAINQLQFRRENQRWQREKIYNLYEDARKCFSELLNLIATTSIGTYENTNTYFYKLNNREIIPIILSLSKLTSVSYDQTLEDLESIKADLTKMLEDEMLKENLHVKIHLLSEKLEEVIKTDSRLKDLFQ